MTRCPALLAVLGVSSLLVLAIGCDCGRSRERNDRERSTKTAEPDEPAEEPPPPARAKERPAAPSDPRFGPASVVLEKVEGRPHAQIRIAIPEGAGVTEGAEQRAAIYFDDGPPISAALTARTGAWRSEDLRLPTAVESAARAIVKIPTTPQTTFVFEVAGAWDNPGPVTLESAR